MTSRYPGGLVRKNAANTAITGASGVWDLGSQAQAVKNNTWPISGLANPVSGSLRFRGSVYPYLSRTPASAGNRQTWTFSAWIKRGNVGAEGTILSGGGTTGRLAVFFNSSGQLISDIGGTGTYDQSTAVFRDPSAWYHFVWVFDTTQATAANRSRMYVNGVEVSLTNTRTFSQNTNYEINNSTLQAIGVLSNSTTTYNLDGCMAEMNFIDGQALTPSYFGQTSAITGVWEPIKYTGTYGTNGYYLSLSDTSSIGKDFSGNGNNWTPNNFSTANDSTFDLMRDVPTQYTPQGATDVGGVVRGNYCTLNPLSNSYTGTTVLSITDGNLNFSDSTSSNRVAIGSMTSPSGKWYFEMTSSSTGTYAVGLYDKVSNGGSFYRNNGAYSSSFGGGGTSGYSSWGVGDVIGVAWDADAGKLWFAKNNTWQSGSPSSGTSPTNTFTAGLSLFPDIYTDNSSGTKSGAFNFGQRPFAYTPPSGFKSLCSTNLPTPTIGATTATAANKYFDATLYTGTGATLSVTNAGGFQPDFVWLKSRSAATNHQLFDAVRGATKVIVGNTNESESTSANTITSFNSGGFTVGTNTAINTSSATYVGWQWNAGGSTVTNTTGSISSQVRASTTAGFSVVTYTGNGSAGATIGHGLGAAPSMLMFKNRDETGGNSILVWHTGFNTNQGQMLLNSTAAIYNPGNGLYFNSTTPGASVVTLGTSGATNASAQNMVMWAWTAIAGYSAFGSYTGNGSTDGPFIFTGFRPRFVIIKASSTTGDWWLEDTSRNPYNAADLVLFPNTSGAESGPNVYYWDFLSNGFKLRSTSAGYNGSGTTYIYMAFAEHPFKNSLAR